MSSEILSVLEYMEKEKGIPRADMIQAIITAIKNAALKGVNAGQELKIEINSKNGLLQAWSVLKVVDSVSDPLKEIHVEKAQSVRFGAGVGEIVEKLKLVKDNPSGLFMMDAELGKRVFTMPTTPAE